MATVTGMETVWSVALDDPTDSVTTAHLVDDVVVLQLRPGPDHGVARAERRPPYEMGVDPRTGAVQWRREHLVGWRPGVRIDGLHLGSILDSTGSRPTIVALAADHQVAWRFTGSGQLHTLTAVDGEIVAVLGRTLHVLDREGRLLRKGAIDKAFPQSVAAAPDGHYLCTSVKGSKTMLRVDPQSLAETWSIKVPGTWAAPDPLVVSGGAAVLYSFPGYAVAVDVATGETRWRRKKVAGRQGICLPLPDGDLLWGTAGLARASGATGKDRWSCPEVATALVVDDARTLVLRAAPPTGVEHVGRGEPEELSLALLDLATGSVTATHPLATGVLRRVHGDKTRERMLLAGDVAVVPAPQGQVHGVRLPVDNPSTG